MSCFHVALQVAGDKKNRLTLIRSCEPVWSDFVMLQTSGSSTDRASRMIQIFFGSSKNLALKHILFLLLMMHVCGSSSTWEAEVHCSVAANCCSQRCVLAEILLLKDRALSLREKSGGSAVRLGCRLAYCFGWCANYKDVKSLLSLPGSGWFGIL